MRRSLPVLAALFSALIVFSVHAIAVEAPPLNPPASSVVLDPLLTSGTWEGWGISFAWWAKIFGDRKDVADLLFTLNQVDVEGQNLPGLGLTIARYNAGACSWNEVDGRKMVVSKTILPFRQIEGFWLDGKGPGLTSWNWNVDANQQAMLRMAKERGANRFELFSNSPMWWMCANGNPSGRASGTEDNLPPKNYPLFANYLATIARQAKEHWGVTFTSIEPFNEPISGYWVENGKQEGCGFSAASQAAFLPFLRKALDEQWLRDMPIAASDETNYSQALKTWNSFSPAVRALVSHVNVHGYEGDNGPRTGLHDAVTKNGKRLWNSEYGDKHGDGLGMARCIGLDFQQLRLSAWCYWQAIDSGNQGGWGLLAGDLIEKKIGKANPKLFVLAQFTRHIRPGMQILQTGSPNLIAAQDGKHLVIVALGGPQAAERTVNLSKFHVANGPVARWITEPKGASRYQKAGDGQVTAGSLKISIPADSIQTFEIPFLQGH